MKFLYEYKSSDGARHDGVLVASNRDAVFAALKRQGIKAYNVRLAPGFANHLAAILHGRIGAALIAALVVAGLAAGLWLTLPHSAETLPTHRCQILGDQQIIEDAMANRWRDVLERHGERWLAMYAQPGRIPRNGLKQVAPFEIYVVVKDFESNLDKPVALIRDDFSEYRQLAAIVETMKDELRAELKAGKTVEQHLEFLAARQAEEYAVWTNAYERVRRSWDAGGDVRDIWVKENAKLLDQNLMALPSIDKFE